MDYPTKRYILEDARKALREGRLSSALSSLHGLSSALGAADEAAETEETAAAYRLLLDYMARGAADPQRGEMYRKFTRRAWELCDHLERLTLISRKETAYATAHAGTLRKPGGDGNPAAALKAGADYHTIFDTLWTAGQLSPAEGETAEACLADGSADLFNRCVAVGALTLAAVQIFDAEKISLLAAAAQSTETALRARALAGLALCHACHRERLALYPALEARLRLLCEESGRAAEMEEVQTQLFLALDAKEVERRLRERIMPEVMKRVRDLRMERSLGAEDGTDDLTAIVSNPEWENAAANNEEARRLMERMKEIYDLQQRGADIFLGTFKALKQRYPFFEMAANWFCPFRLSHPALGGVEKSAPLLHLLTGGNFLCDSDKYSLALMSAEFPQGGKLADMVKGLPPEFADAPQTAEDDFSALPFPQAARSYIQSLYRFFHLYRHHGELRNPFKEDLFFLAAPPFDTLLSDGARLLRIADFLFAEKSYAKAQELYARLPDGDKTADIWQKTGFCHQKLNRPDRAAAAYREALERQPASEWTLRSLAACHRALGEHAEALACYQQMERLPGGADDAGLALQEAECLLRIGRNEEALKPLFKSHYLRADNLRTLRALAWCHLLTGKYQQAERYYVQILGGTPSAADFLNAGHAAWLSGRPAEAVQRYARSVETDGERKNDFLTADADLLLGAGLTETDLRLMAEAVALRVQKEI